MSTASRMRAARDRYREQASGVALRVVAKKMKQKGWKQVKIKHSSNIVVGINPDSASYPGGTTCVYDGHTKQFFVRDERGRQLKRQVYLPTAV